MLHWLSDMEYVDRGAHHAEKLRAAHKKKQRPAGRLVQTAHSLSIQRLLAACWAHGTLAMAKRMSGNNVRRLIVNTGIYYSVILCMAGGVSAHIQAQVGTPTDENLAMQSIASNPSALLTPPPLPTATLPPAAPPAPAAPLQPPASAANSIQSASAISQAAPQVRQAGSAGNTYSRGYCTWYAKSKRPDLPNNLGNANTWAVRARNQGIPTGAAPQAGAIGQRGMHVVYVERVNADGTVFITEMNYAGFGIVSTRTVPASYFQYIY